jgi:hypothetical protein
MDRLPNADQLAKEMADLCKQAVKSAAQSGPSVLLVVVTALANSEILKGKGFWSAS